jgi:hypothetical protein
MLQRPWDKDRYMAPDIEEVTNILLEDKIWGAVQHHIAYYHAPEVSASLSDFQAHAQLMTCLVKYCELHISEMQKDIFTVFGPNLAVKWLTLCFIYVSCQLKLTCYPD